MKPFWRYYGGKWRIAPRYPEPLPRLPIVEPFAGAAGYSTRYGAHRDVILVERDPKIAAIWRWLIDATRDDVLSVGDVPDGGTVDDIDAPQAARWLAGFWCNNGVAQPGKTPSKWSRISESNGWGDRARRRIASQVDAIRSWEVIEGDWHQIGGFDATWFVDPPYQTAAGRHYKHHAIDHARLGAWCMEQGPRVIACDQMGADWLPFDLLAHTRTQRTKEGKRSPEAIWTKGADRPVNLDLFGP
jgi:site-specific DNA-adenine methylase